jgi:hypothetical protein
VWYRCKIKTAQIPLSNDVIHDIICDISEAIRREVVQKTEKCGKKISLQLNEQIDVSNYAQLLALCSVCIRLQSDMNLSVVNL